MGNSQFPTSTLKGTTFLLHGPLICALASPTSPGKLTQNVDHYDHELKYLPP